MNYIPVAGPWITEKEVRYVSEATRDGWYGNSRKYIDMFEQAFAEYTHRKYALALPFCTSGIHLALLASGIKKDAEVIVPDLTWTATAEPIVYVGAMPVFADCDERTWCIDVISLHGCITHKTKAVIPVDLYGGMPDMETVCNAAHDNGLVVIEDAAEAIGSKYRGCPAGSFGDISVFSFHGTKTLTTGEGGMLVTDDKKIYEKCRYLANHASVPGNKKFWNGEIGYSYRMSSLQAALGLAQLERIDELVARKRDIFYQYRNNLKSEPGIIMNCEMPNVFNSFWMTTAIINGVPKEYIMAELDKIGINTRPFFYPLSSQPAYAGVGSSNRAQQLNSVSYKVSPYGVNLPSAMNITRGDIDYVCDILKLIIRCA